MLADAVRRMNGRVAATKNQQKITPPKTGAISPGHARDDEKI